MLLHLLDASFRLGYRPAVSADVSAKYATDSDGNPDYPLDVHTIYLVKLDQQQQQQQVQQYQLQPQVQQHQFQPQAQQQADPDPPPTYDMAMGF